MGGTPATPPAYEMEFMDEAGNVRQAREPGQRNARVQPSDNSTHRLS